MRALVIAVCILAVTNGACALPALDPPGRACARDADCGAGHFCADESGNAVCLPGALGVEGPRNRAPLAGDALVVARAASVARAGRIALADADLEDARFDAAVSFVGGASFAIEEDGRYTLTAPAAVDADAIVVARDARAATLLRVRIVALDDGVPALLEWTGASSRAFGVAANWSPPLPPDGQRTAILDAAVSQPQLDELSAVDGLFSSAGTALALNSTLVARNVATAGAVSGPGSIEVLADGALSGAAPSLSVSSAKVRGPLRAASLLGDTLTVLQGSHVNVDNAMILDELVVEPGATVIAGTLSLGTLRVAPEDALDPAAQVIVVVNGDVSISTLIGAQMLLFAAGSGARVIDVPDLPYVAIGKDADATLTRIAAVDELFSEGGVGVAGEALAVGVMRIARSVRAVDGSGTIAANVCDEPDTLRVEKPAYVVCRDIE